MFRKTGIGLAALAMLAPGLAAALGVGDYRLNSFLNQPLDMEVDLFDARDLAPEEVLVSLGSNRDFENAGVERVFFLNELRFEVDLRPGGQGALRITTDQPVREPYLSFIVEYMWPTGRLLREYTVLLDPPTFSEPVSRPMAPPAAVQTIESTAPVSVSTPATAQPTAPATRAAPAADSFGTTRGPDYVVQQSDTMWRIALNNRPVNSISVQQMLIAIQQLNPNAFIDGNVNLVREGTVLRMPTEQEIRQNSTRESIAQVAEQNREWRAKLEARGIAVPGRTQLDGTAGTRRTVSAGVATEGQVTLVSPDAVSGEGTGRGTTGTGDAAALQNELAIRDENVDRLGRENRELSSRLKDLQEQVTTSERLLRLRNEQIAQLQEQLREVQKAQGMQPSEPIVIEPVEEAAAVAVEEDTAVEDAAGPADEVADEAAADSEIATEDAQPVAEPVVETAPVVTSPVRPVPPAPASQPGIMDLIMQNLLLIVAGFVAIIAVVGGMLWMRKRKEATDDDGDEEEFAEGDGDDDFFAAAQDFDDESDDDGESAPAETAQDPLEEVDVYTAYGRHAEAVTFLRNEIRKAPQRDDLKVRLLEVLAEMNDRDGFERESAGFAGAGASVTAAIAALRSRLSGAEQEPSLDDLEMDLASDFDAPTIKAKAPAADEELDLDLGGDEELGSLDFTMNEPAPVQPAEPELSLDLGGDDDLSLEDEGLTLDLDADSEDELSLEDDSLSLELDAAEELTLDDEEDLSLDFDAPAKPSVALDDINVTLDEDNDFGEISLTDVSDEFSEAAVSTSSEEIDLSLDDLSLDEDISLEEPAAPAASPAATVQRDALDLGDAQSLDKTAARPAVEPALEQALTGDDDDFDFLGDTDENATKLDLAKAYIDMGDSEGAQDILQEVISEGNPQQQQEAKDLLAQVS